MAEKTALCIGINDYPGTNSDLAGCVNDAQDWADVLGERGFEVTQLLDSDATKSAMTDAISSVVSAAASGDNVVITYSGHGTWQPDENADEPDMRDEALCPYDLQDNGALLDDELFEIFADAERGARVVLLSDSCHSGSVTRMGPPQGADRGRVRFLPPATFLSDDKVARAAKVEKAPARGMSRGTALLISGCMDTEYSYDASFDDRPNGAFTRAAIDALSALPDDATYANWFKAIREVLPNPNYPQTPQLMASRRQRKWPILAG